MKIAIVIFSVLFLSPVLASTCHDACTEELKTVSKEARQCVAKTDCDPKLRQKDRKIKEAAATEKKLLSQIDELKRQLGEAEEKYSVLAAAHQKTGRELIEERVKTKTQVIIMETEKPENSISLIIPFAPTKLIVEDMGSRVTARTAQQEDIGLMYQRDFDDIRGSLALSVRGIAILGVGITF